MARRLRRNRLALGAFANAGSDRSPWPSAPIRSRPTTPLTAPSRIACCRRAGCPRGAGALARDRPGRTRCPEPAHPRRAGVPAGRHRRNRDLLARRNGPRPDLWLLGRADRPGSLAPHRHPARLPVHRAGGDRDLRDRSRARQRDRRAWPRRGGSSMRAWCARRCSAPARSPTSRRRGPWAVTMCTS